MPLGGRGFVTVGAAVACCALAAACTPDHFHECSSRGKELHTIVSRVSHINCSGIIDGDASRPTEFTVTASHRSPFCNECAGTIEFLNAIVPCVGYVDVVSRIDRYTDWVGELAIAASTGPNRGDWGTGGGEFPNELGAQVNDVDIA